MSFAYFSQNGELLPVDQAVLSLDDIAYSYGFGVYETIRVTNGTVYFLDQHLERLAASASAIELDHNFSTESIEQAIHELIAKNTVETCNLKILLIGGRTADDAQLYIQCLNPLFPDRKLYSDGAHTITENYVRRYPEAKTLNMLPSYLAYRKAQKSNAYDALLVDHDDCIREGTRTNFFVMQGKMIISPPNSKILPGVMRQVVLKIARDKDFEIQERDIPLTDLPNFDAAFVTSVSSKVMPIKSINDHHFGEPSENLRELIHLIDTFLAACNGLLSD